ncbi:MAG: hypothetical protein M0T70_06675 [Geobacteraceae bacterium]|nr:hypothetical protein [Geobacteraceae bacterium]
MNYQAAMFYLTLVMTVVNIIIGISVWWTNKEKVNSSRFKEVEERVTKVEGRVDRMPVCDNHSRIEKNDIKLFERMDELHGDIRELVGGVESLTKTIYMINQHLMNGGTK